MNFQETLHQFSNPQFLPEGWFWLARSRDVRKGKAVPASFWGKDFVIYRGEDEVVRVMDAHCPHMGAHLCDGRVEKNSIRCPFHFWKFDDEGVCEEIPVQANTKNVPSLHKYLAKEAYGLIWIWTGGEQDIESTPVIPELSHLDVDWSHGNQFFKACHPNVVMINAIDAHHFKSVHKLVVDLDMETRRLSDRCIQFSNRTPLPPKNALLRWAGKFYAKSLTYEMTYWWGNTGSVMVGPDFLHFYIIFALRPTVDGKSEGQTLLVTPKRKSVFGKLFNSIVLFLTKLVGNYFAKGDTIIFSRIKFNFQTPIRADRAIIDFIEHYENQKPSPWIKVTKNEERSPHSNGSSDRLGHIRFETSKAP